MNEEEYKPSKLTHALGEAMGVIIILILLIPLASLSLRASIVILQTACEVRYERR